MQCLDRGWSVWVLGESKYPRYCSMMGGVVYNGNIYLLRIPKVQLRVTPSHLPSLLFHLPSLPFHLPSTFPFSPSLHLQQFSQFRHLEKTQSTSRVTIRVFFLFWKKANFFKPEKSPSSINTVAATGVLNSARVDRNPG